ncbi:cellulase, partial [Polyplosphaeria fusca]
MLRHRASPSSRLETALTMAAIVDIIRANSHTAFSLIIEPNAMASFVTNPNNASCSHVQRSYRQNVPLALKKLDLPNVVTYLDAAHGGIFGWRYWGIDYPNSASDEMLRTWTAAGTLTQFRGLAVNVGSYNAWDLSPGETFDGENPTCPDDNKARSEILYLQILRRTLQSALKRANSTSAMPFHAIMDTSRSGVQGIRSHWTDWCNVKEASFGIYPVAFGKDNLDAFVWATMPGFSDGASEVGSIGYTPDCALVDSFKPMPARGMWSQEYFESLFRWFR